MLNTNLYICIIVVLNLLSVNNSNELMFTIVYMYSRTCLGRPPLLPSKNGRSRQVVSHSRSYKNHVLPLSTFLQISSQAVT